VVGIALGRPGSRAINLAVGNGDFSRRLSSQYNVLATNEGCFDVVNPYHVGAIDGNTITSPDEFGVDLGDVDVLDNDVADTISHTQPDIAC
jgi:hypothetical protein